MQARRPGPFHKPHCTGTARHEDRIGKVARDPLLSVKAFWDIGVRDATAIWIVQYVGREIQALDYYEAVRQPLAAHLEWLRTKVYGGAECFLPHDASHEDAVTAIRFEDHIRSAGFDVTTVPNQGKRPGPEACRGRPPAVPALVVQRSDVFAGFGRLGMV
ncbi:hypothetical protein [Mesorhizobium sp. f-mel]